MSDASLLPYTRTEIETIVECLEHDDPLEDGSDLQKRWCAILDKYGWLDKNSIDFAAEMLRQLLRETGQSNGRLWWREALEELASSYEVQASAAAANGNDDIAEHYSNTAYGVRKAFEKLNLVEQRQPTEQAKDEMRRV